MAYYDTVGASDDIRICIDSGGYAPRFEKRTPSAAPDHPVVSGARWQRKTIGLIAVAGIVLVSLLGVLVLQLSDPTDTVAAVPKRDIERLALASKSPATLQAANFCDQARGLLFPIASIGNQKLASDIFRRAMESDPSYSCSYAGLGHSLATSALLSPRSDTRTELVQEALAMAQRAVELAPTDGWAQSALAWASYLDGDTDSALEHSALAQALAPRDGNVLDFRSLVLVVMGEFEDAYEVTDPRHPRETGSHRFAHRNLHAVASFHLEKYDEAIASLTFAAQNGDPVSPLSLVFLAASHQGMSNSNAAQSTLDQLQKSWPDFQPDATLSSFYLNSRDSEKVISMLVQAGWKSPQHN